MTDRKSLCPRCQASLPAEAAACPACGAVFSAMPEETASSGTSESMIEATELQETSDVLEPSSPTPPASDPGQSTCPVIDFDRLEKLTDWNLGLVLLFFGFLLMTSFT